MYVFNVVRINFCGLVVVLVLSNFVGLFVLMIKLCVKVVLFSMSGMVCVCVWVLFF